MANAPTYLNHSGQAEDAQGVIIVNEDGTFADLSGGVGGGGDASAANQASQITQETATAAALGTTAGAAVITDANGTIQQYLRGLVTRWVNALGAGTAAAALRTTSASDDPAVTHLAQIEAAVESTTPVTVQTSSEYETVAASQTAQVLGPTGATGDYIEHVVIIPATTAPGLVTLIDNATSIPIYVGGTVTAALHPWNLRLGMTSVSGAWKITTGANVSVIAVGNFT